MIEYFAALVDRTGEWGPLVEARLRSAAKPPYEVIGFNSGEHLMEMIEKQPMRVPFTVVADTDAVSPTAELGVFARLKPVVGRCRPVFYTANPNGEVLRDLSRVASFKLVARTSRDSIQRLQAILDEEISDLEQSSDFALVSMYEQYVKETPRPEISTVDDDQLSPLSILREMARGSSAGRRYLRHLIPPSWATQKHI